MTVVGKKVSSQSKINTQPVFPHRPSLAEKSEEGECNRLGDPGSESELASESARVLHSEAGRLVDRFPSFQLSCETAPNETRARESFGLDGVGEFTGGNVPGNEVRPARDGVRLLAARTSIWGLHIDNMAVCCEIGRAHV